MKGGAVRQLGHACKEGFPLGTISESGPLRPWILDASPESGEGGDQGGGSHMSVQRQQGATEGAGAGPCRSALVEAGAKGQRQGGTRRPGPLSRLPCAELACQEFQVEKAVSLVPSPSPAWPGEVFRQKETLTTRYNLMFRVFHP